MATEKNRWFTTEAEEAELRKESQAKQELLNALPEYRKSERDKYALCDLLTSMLFVEANHFTITPSRALPSERIETHLIENAEVKLQKPLTYGEDHCDTQAYQDFQQGERKFRTAIRHYAAFYRSSQWNEHRYDHGQVESVVGSYFMDTLRQAFKRASAAFDVGSSLYIYQQMHDRRLSEAPSLSKAAWLVKNAPTRKPIPEKQTPRGKWELIQEQWKNHIHDAHCWAAVVCMMKSPLQYNENTLFDFIRDADYDQFLRLTRTFYEFRLRANIPKSAGRIRPYLKQISPSVPENLENFEPIPPSQVPAHLESFQWDALSRYRARPRKLV
ncbi:hypothetical protein [Janthinobacterium sp. SUN033]|uniref:hypothetical protein n=1 Tax=Janthinobacterium sp. SUN033 TaxID=3002439 RepID=UPI0025B11D70|nr:hypothetical protein [Janthinobacterium sp. SUN033]MDN2677660.1 hypothetical protein [Janthinobacterium sp. SUN033]